MSQGLSGPGLGLPPPQNLYPTLLLNAPVDASSNRIGLAAGQVFNLPAGNWLVPLRSYCILQYQDPVNGNWTMGATAAWDGGTKFVKSDGFSIRIANLTGCPVSAG